MSVEAEAKMAPHSKEAEMMVLGCMLTNKKNLKYGAANLDDSDFYYTEHKIIFSVLKHAHKDGHYSDVHLVCEELKRTDKLKSVGGPSYVMTLAQYAGTSAYVEEYCKIVQDKSLLRNLISASQEVGQEALDNPDSPTFLIEKLQNNLKNLEQKHGKRIPIISPKEHLERQEIFLNKHRGKNIIGLRTSKIPEFNTHLLGLRELTLLAAPPNAGKTALTIQLGIDVLENEKEACLIYVSLEMSSLAIFNRMTLHFAEIPFNTFVLGSQRIQTANEEVFFAEEEFRKIEKAKEKLHSFGERLQIIDSEICPFMDAKMIINYVESVKSKTNCNRAIVVIDYLQVWPTPQNIGSENDADKWRIREMKKIRDGLQNDPLVVISEARKPSDKNEQWGSDLADVMGSARGTYTPDAVMLLSPLTPKQLEAMWKKRGSHELPDVWINDYGDDKHKQGKKIQNFLAYHGIAMCALQMAKVRDGMQKFNINLAFNFKRNLFETIKWDEIDRLPKDKNTSNMRPSKESQKSVEF